MMKRAALWRLRGVRGYEVVGVWDVDGFAVVGDLVPVAGNRIDVFEAVCGVVSASVPHIFPHLGHTHPPCQAAPAH